MTGDPRELLDQVVEAVRRTPSMDRAGGSGGQMTSDRDGQVLEGLDALRRLRALLLGWEPVLIEAAREQGVSWARLAPVLGVTSRQAAERRYLRLRPGGQVGLTGDQRVQATRDERAGDRAVAAWARENAAELRQIAGRASAATGLSRSGRQSAKTLASSLTGDDPSLLIEPLADMHVHLVEDHAGLAAQVDEVSREVSRVRHETQRRRDSAAQS